MEGKERIKGQIQKKGGEKEWNVRRPRGHYLKFLVTLLLMGPVCLLSQGRFQEPVPPAYLSLRWGVSIYY